MAIPLFIFAATKSTFSQLDQAYLPILNQLLDDQEEEDKEVWLLGFQELVGSIIVLESPLSISSLEQLLKILQMQIRCRLDSLHSILSIPDSKSAPVRILHLSFHDFLIDPQKKKS
ncbi:MAG: hypothetical protein M1839_001615 [Geoglossum umbratile]|nr:MAG: hypothetical protein M1839_001615 [Geoglossum umbratile]